MKEKFTELLFETYRGWLSRMTTGRLIIFNKFSTVAGSVGETGMILYFSATRY